MSLIEPLSDAAYLDRWRSRSRYVAPPVVRGVQREVTWQTFSERHTVPTFDQYMARLIKGGHPVVKRVLLDVAQRHGVTIEEIVSRSRALRVAYARHEALYAIYMETDLSLSAIGMRLGQRDFSSIWYGISAHAKRHGLSIAKEPRP